MSSWKPALKVFNEEPFYQNGQTFATKEEAEKSARNRYSNWMQAEAWRADEVDSSEHPVNYIWVDGVGDVRIEEPVVPLLECINPKINPETGRPYILDK